MSWECADPYHPGVALPPGRGWLGHCAALCSSTATLFMKGWVTLQFWPLSSFLFLAKKQMRLSHRWCTSQPRILTSCCSYCFAVESLYLVLSMESSFISRQTSKNWRSRRYAFHLRPSGFKTSFICCDVCITIHRRWLKKRAVKSDFLISCMHHTSKLLPIVFAKRSIQSNEILNKVIISTLISLK